MTAGKLSPGVFDTLRKAARVKGPNHGGLDWMFSTTDLLALLHRAESGNFSIRGETAAVAWRAMLIEKGVTPPEARAVRAVRPSK